jgi:hypothetical protein
MAMPSIRAALSSYCLQHAPLTLATITPLLI